MDSKEDQSLKNKSAIALLTLKSEREINLDKLSLWQKMLNMKKNITVEPALAMFVVPSVLAMLATQNLNLEKACGVNLKYGNEVCTALRLRKRVNYTAEELQVQNLIATVQAWKNVLHAAIPTILMLFFGAWSDKTGKRKICMLAPIFGEIITCLLNIMNTWLFYQVSVEWTVFMEVIFTSLTGGWYIMTLGTYSYLGDITSKDTRTFRFGILSLCMTIGFPIGMGLSGILLKHLGYYGVFTISLSLQIINFCYVLFWVEDHTWLENKNEVPQKGCMAFLGEFFDFQSLKKTIQVAFKKGPKNRRLKICLVLCAVCLTFGPIKGTIFAISFLSRRVKVDDAALGMVSAVSKICGALMTAFASDTYQIYAVPMIEILSGSSIIAMRSIASKLVTYQELGKINSLFGLVETMTPLIFAPLYSRVYIRTLRALPGAVFLLSVKAALPALIIFIWFYHQHKKDSKDQRYAVSSTASAEESPQES
ncbi:hypothetical protein EVAR_58056_1 [Eumeta japonica]|uniref:Proton-coupled folate transporter n=1 Tax=Eumeta variegata TaxID=151549 RepID=A0A4C1YYR6_EUMVA|nr:hypothetical protein EVAR_58056_1 [Eumeta japonica]